MTRTVPIANRGEREIGYALIALPSDQTKERIAALLGELSMEMPNVLWPTPPEALHITLCQIIEPRSYSQDKEELYSQNAERYQNVPRQVLSPWPKFNITFDSIEAHPQAIIIKASDARPFNEIRTQLMGRMALPSETRMPPDITFCTIARYAAETELERVQAATSARTVSITEEIKEFRLTKSFVPPLLEYETIETYPLA